MSKFIVFPHKDPRVLFFHFIFFQRSQYIKGAGIVRMRVIFEEGPYMRKYGRPFLHVIHGHRNERTFFQALTQVVSQISVYLGDQIEICL